MTDIERDALRIGMEIAADFDRDGAPKAAHVESIAAALRRARAEADAEAVVLREALLDCANLNIPFPDEKLPGGDTDFMRGVVKGHEEARQYCDGRARTALSSTPRAKALADVVRLAEQAREEYNTLGIEPATMLDLADALARLTDSAPAPPPAPGTP